MEIWCLQLIFYHPNLQLLRDTSVVYVKGEVINVAFKGEPVYMPFKLFRFFKRVQIKNSERHLYKYMRLMKIYNQIINHYFWNITVRAHNYVGLVSKPEVIHCTVLSRMGFPGGDSGKEPTCQCWKGKQCGFDPWVRKIPWRQHGNPLQHSWLENPMDRGAWWATAHKVAELEMNEVTWHTHTPSRICLFP